MRVIVIYMSELFANYWMVAIKLALALATAVIFLKMFNMNSQLKQLTPISVVLNFLLSAILSSFILDSEFTIMDFFVIRRRKLFSCVNRVDTAALEKIGKTELWLMAQLHAQKIRDPENVFIAQYHHGKMQVIKKK